MRFDLGRVGIHVQLERLDETLADVGPVRVWNGGEVCIEVAHGAIHFTEDRHCLPTLQGAPQARSHVRKLLSQRGRTRRLSMGPREHREIRMAMGKLRNLIDACLERFHEEGARGFQHPGVTEVVDIFRCAAEMNELERCLARAGRAQLLPDVILDGFDVVVDAGLDVLDRGGGTFIGIVRKQPGAFDNRSGQCRSGQLWHRGRQVQQPVCLDADALANEPRFGQDAAQGRRCGTITSINGRKSLDRGQSVAVNSRHAYGKPRSATICMITQELSGVLS